MHATLELVGQLVGLSVCPSITFLNSERFLHYCSCPTIRDWIAVYPALFVKKSLKNHKSKNIFFVENSAWCQMKENYLIYIPFQFCLRDQLVNREYENHVSLEYVKKLKTDFNFFPDHTDLIMLTSWSVGPLVGQYIHHYTT